MHPQNFKNCARAAGPCLSRGSLVDPRDWSRQSTAGFSSTGEVRGGVEEVEESQVPLQKAKVPLAVHVPQLSQTLLLVILAEVHLLPQAPLGEAAVGGVHSMLVRPLPHLLPCDLRPRCRSDHGTWRLALCGVHHLPQTPVAELVSCKLQSQGDHLPVSSLLFRAVEAEEEWDSLWLSSVPLRDHSILECNWNCLFCLYSGGFIWRVDSKSCTSVAFGFSQTF